MSSTNQTPIQPEDEINHFLAIPWCAKLLAAPNLIVAPVFSRAPSSDSTPLEDAFFSQTLKTPTTIPALVCFYPRPAAGSKDDEDDTLLLPQLHTLAALEGHVNGYDGLCHGGVVAALFDEILSLLHPGSRWRAYKTGRARSVVTASLHTTYLKPVRTPGTYLFTVRVRRVEGRKVFVEGEMEDEVGVKLARAEALFIELRENL